MEGEEDLEFRSARDGDHLMGIPFECNLCHFWNMARKDPDWDSPEASFQLTCISGANLDVFWMKRPSTIALNQQRIWLDH